MFNKVTKTFQYGQHTVTLETGEIDRQASGAVLVSVDDTVVLATVVARKDAKPGQDFFPLTVDYVEKTYAAGKIPGGFFKREGRPSEKEILTSRLIDRPIRPLFPEGYLNETQVIGMVLSADPDRDPSTLAMVGAAAALAISDIPFHHVLGAVRVGMVKGQLVANPSYDETREATFSIVVAGTADGIVMVEAGGTGVPEDEVVRAIDFGHDCCRKVVAGIRDLMAKAGKPKRQFTPEQIDQTLYDEISAKVRAELTDAMNTEKYRKLESYHKIADLKTTVADAYDEDRRSQATDLFDRLKERIFRDEMLKAKRRPDGRAFD